MHTSGRSSGRYGILLAPRPADGELQGTTLVELPVDKAEWYRNAAAARTLAVKASAWYGITDADD